MTPFDLAGTLGVVLIIGAYLLLQTGRLASDRPIFSAVNAAGAALIIVSLTADFNASAMAVEVFWLMISLYGVYRATSSRSSSSSSNRSAPSSSSPPDNSR